MLANRSSCGLAGWARPRTAAAALLAPRAPASVVAPRPGAGAPRGPYGSGARAPCALHARLCGARRARGPRCGAGAGAEPGRAAPGSPEPASSSSGASSSASDDEQSANAQRAASGAAASTSGGGGGPQGGGDGRRQRGGGGGRQQSWVQRAFGGTAAGQPWRVLLNVVALFFLIRLWPGGGRALGTRPESINLQVCPAFEAAAARRLARVALGAAATRAARRSCKRGRRLVARAARGGGVQQRPAEPGHTQPPLHTTRPPTAAAPHPPKPLPPAPRSLSASLCAACAPTTCRRCLSTAWTSTFRSSQTAACCATRPRAQRARG